MASGKIQLTGIFLDKTPAHRATAKISGVLDRRTTSGTVELKNNSESINRLYAFFLVYGAEAVLPADIEHDSPRVTQYTEAEVQEARQNDVDLLEEARELALSRSAIYQQNLRCYHSRKVCP